MAFTNYICYNKLRIVVITAKTHTKDECTKMIKIAICDDERFFVDVLKKMVLNEIRQLGIRAEVSVFYDGQRLVEEIEGKKRFDLIFMDIKMPEMNGIEVGRCIRQLDRNTLLIYVSGYEEYLRDLFEVEPFRFLSKPVLQKELHDYFVKAIARIGEADDFYQFRFNKEIKKVLLTDIVYFESSNRVVHIYLQNGEIEQFYGKLNEVEQELMGRGKAFLRIHQSFLVNYRYIRKLNFSTVTVDMGKQGLRQLKVSEERQKNIRMRICQLAEEQ